MGLSLGLGLGLDVGLTACSPTLDWRTARLGDDLELQFPCKPDRIERQVPVLDRTVPALMLVCDAGGQTWSATRFEWTDAARSAQALRELRHRLLLNMKAGEDQSEPASVLGMTPNAEARRSRLVGVRPDGSAAHAQALFAEHGARLYQLVVIAAQPAPEPSLAPSAEFLDALRWATRAP